MSDKKVETKKDSKSDLDKLSIEMNKLRQEKMNQIQIRVSSFLKELESEGFGLDASIEVNRYGNKVNIFVVEIARQS